MNKTKVRYYVDIIDKETGQTVVTVYDSYNSDEAYDVAKHWNEDLLERHSVLHNPCVMAEVYEVEEYEEEEEVKKKWEFMKLFGLKDYKQFCKEALIAPPAEEDTARWCDERSVRISANGCIIELPYDVDVINEVEFALREIYEAIEGDGEATTGNTFGSQYRSAELKDVVRYFIMYRYENSHAINWFKFAKQAVEELSDIDAVLNAYEEAYENEKVIEFKCNWQRFKMDSLRDANKEGIKKIILDLVGSNIEISYDSHTDKSFIIDYTFKDSGDFVDWCWGTLDEHDDSFRILLDDFKSKIFED